METGGPECKVLPAGQLQLQGSCDEGPSTQFATEAAMKDQNHLLKRVVEEKEFEITELERKIARMETIDTGIHLVTHCTFRVCKN